MCKVAARARRSRIESHSRSRSARPSASRTGSAAEPSDEPLRVGVSRNPQPNEQVERQIVGPAEHDAAVAHEQCANPATHSGEVRPRGAGDAPGIDEAPEQRRTSPHRPGTASLRRVEHDRHRPLARAAGTPARPSGERDDIGEPKIAVQPIGRLSSRAASRLGIGLAICQHRLPRRQGLVEPAPRRVDRRGLEALVAGLRPLGDRAQRAR